MKSKVLFGIVSVLLICLVAQFCSANNPSTQSATAVPSGETIDANDIGKYQASGEAPDILTTSGSNIEVTGGSGSPENTADEPVAQFRR